MNLKTAIYNHVLEKLYIRLYMCMERKANIFNKRKNKQEIIELLTEIILIKEKYNIPYEEDLDLLEKHKL